MRRNLVIWAALILCCLAGMLSVQSAVSATGQQVRLTETVSLGDKTVAEGITIRMINQYQEKIYWDTEYTVGTEETKTQFVYFGDRSEELTPYWHEYDTTADVGFSVQMRNEDVSAVFEPMEGRMWGYQEVLDFIEKYDVAMVQKDASERIGEEVEDEIYIDDDLILVLYDFRNLLVYERTENDTYAFCFEMEIYVPEEQAGIYYYQLPRSCSIDYNGEYLAMCGYLPQDEIRTSALSACDVYLSIYDENGLVYYGEYVSSLTSGLRLNSDYVCYAAQGGIPVSLSWDR